MELHETLYSIALNFYSVLTTIKKINNAGILLKQDKSILIYRFFVYRNVELVFKLDYRNSYEFSSSPIHKDFQHINLLQQWNNSKSEMSRMAFF